MAELEQVEDMISKGDVESLNDIEWWDGAWNIVEPHRDKMKRADKTVFAWADATATARDILVYGDVDPNRIKFNATLFSLHRDYVPTRDQVTHQEFLQGMYSYLRLYGTDSFVEVIKDPTKFNRFHPLWTRFYRESNYFLTLEPQSVLTFMDYAVTQGKIPEAVIRDVARAEGKSYRSIAINLRYIYKIVDDPAFLEAARTAERLHRKERI